MFWRFMLQYTMQESSDLVLPVTRSVLRPRGHLCGATYAGVRRAPENQIVIYSFMLSPLLAR